MPVCGAILSGIHAEQSTLLFLLEGLEIEVELELKFLGSQLKSHVE